MKNNGWFCWICIKKVFNLGKVYYLIDNKLSWDFYVDKFKEKFVIDIIYLYFGNCKLYFLLIMDFYN